MFASEIKSVIFRPNWIVPLSIVRAEMLPHIEKDPAYLAKNSYEIVDSMGTAVGSSSLNEEMKRQLRSGKLGIRQIPGPNNALGLLKFDFPNQHDVYMHGTPAMELFSRTRRDFSHGCIRVEDPVALGGMAPSGSTGMGRQITSAPLPWARKPSEWISNDPVPVPDCVRDRSTMENGEVDFFRDIYGQDAALEQALLNHAYSD